MPYLTSTLDVQATLAEPSATLTIQDTSVSGDTGTSQIQLTTGVTTISVTVRAGSGATQIYTIVVMRSLYVKASNTDAFDNFGAALSLFEDTLAVGPLGESSSTKGVGGDEADNSANSSGAVYICQQ